MKKVIPIKDFILLEREESKGKIIVPDTAKIGADEVFIVTAVGKECKEIKVGDSVITVAKVLGMMNFEDRTILFSRETNVSAVIREV